MQTRDSLQCLEETIAYYLEQLRGISEDQLILKPSEDDWSIGQMVVHLIQATQNMSLRNIDLCKEGNPDTIVASTKTEAGEAMFLNNGFPDVKISVPPSPQYTPQQPNGKEELSQGLNNIIQRMKEIEPAINGIPMERAMNHPRLGALNAQEWFVLAEFHFRHHLKQLHRLQQSIGAGAS
ncbi:DinB family protein [Cohnella sp. WQ 127256]|uniref:DinB family protein n=1 Tax=Cohnella sp. WQ 127256 TaxID=2938790 RepID=UPI0021193814|nr:DinB family protein [Cohnella sp. WQ 127256]